MKRELEEALCKVGLELGSKKLKLLIEYLGLIADWNKTRNLVSRKASTHDLIEHLVDCLLVNERLDHKKVADFGSGAGLPGVCIAIYDRDKEILLVEPNKKKTSFLAHVKSKLGLSNLTILTERMESIEPRQLGQYKNIVLRALMPPKEFLKRMSGKLSSGTKIIFMVAENKDYELEKKWKTNYYRSKFEKKYNKKRGFLEIIID